MFAVFKPIIPWQSLFNNGRLSSCVTRFYQTGLKKFYKTATVAGVSNTYEVNLDQRKLKTPLGTVLEVSNLPLALAIAEEWNSVKGHIIPSWMHLTSLSFTAIDNPLRTSKWDLVGKIVEFLDTDTLLYRDDAAEDFYNAQCEKWDPVVDWFTEKFQLSSVKPVYGLYSLEISSTDRETIRNYLLQYNFWSIVGLMQGVETLKSLIATIACLEGRITVEEAVELSLFETTFQADQWGRLESVHQLDEKEHLQRFSAAVLFIRFCSEDIVTSRSMK